MRLSDEPVMLSATTVGVALMALLALANSMGWINLSGEQMNEWQRMFAAVLPLLFAAIPLLAGVWARSKVKPMSKIERGE